VNALRNNALGTTRQLDLEIESPAVPRQDPKAAHRTFAQDDTTAAPADPRKVPPVVDRHCVGMDGNVPPCRVSVALSAHANDESHDDLDGTANHTRTLSPAALDQ